MSRAARVVGVLLLCVLAMAGCSTLAALQNLSSEIQAAGYANVNINQQVTNGHSLLVIEAMRNETLDDADADEIAKIAWTKFSGEFDELRVVLNGELVLTAVPEDLRSRFGERPAGLGEESSGGLNVTALVVILLCVAVLVVILVVVWRRGRRPPPGPNRYPPRHRPSPYGPPQP